MPRSPTPAQAEASRRNGQRSTGPTSPEGKARSSQNARTFGLRSARLAFVGNEDQAAFDQLEQAIHDRFQPACALEAAICARMVRALWRCERAQQLERSFWCLYPSDVQIGATHPLIRLLVSDQDKGRTSLSTILRYLAEADRAFARALKDLDQLRRGVGAPVEEAEAPDEAESCTDEPEPANDDRPDQSDDTSEPEPPAALPPPEPDEPLVLEAEAAAEADEETCTHEPEPAPPAAPVRTEPPPSATPPERALHELAYLRAWIASRWPEPMHEPAEAFVLQFGADGKGPPTWVRDLPAGTRLAKVG